jgi:hypothetical protein
MSARATGAPTPAAEPPPRPRPPPVPPIRGMTSGAKRTAAIVGILGALALPRKVPCLAPSVQCDAIVVEGASCTPTDVEPLGIYALEWIVGRDIGLRYKRTLVCT